MYDWSENDRQALDQLVTLLYDELHRLASNILRSEWRRSLGTTSLVHETYLRLARQKRARCRDRPHFLRLCAGFMRDHVVDRARWHLRAKRRGREVPVDEAPPIADPRAPEPSDLDEALTRLASLEPQLAEITGLRFFIGLKLRETAERLGVSVPTVSRRWRCARRQLRGLLERGS